MAASLLAAAIVWLLCYGRVPQPLATMGAVLFPLCAFWLRRGRRHSHALLSIDAWAQRSRLNGWHTGLKVCFCLLCTLFCIGFRSVWVPVFAALGMMAATVGIGRVPAGYYLRLLAVPSLFILLGTAAVLVECSPEPLGLLDLPVGGWYLSITAAGQRRALELALRALGAVSCLYLLSLSTPLHRVIGFLRRAKLPALLVELMYLIYRYLFVLLELLQQMQIAADARLGYRDWGSSLRTMASCARGLLFLSFRRSSDCFAAMEARCYDGELLFLEPEERLRPKEILAAGGYLMLLVCCGCLFGRFGG